MADRLQTGDEAAAAAAARLGDQERRRLKRSRDAPSDEEEGGGGGGGGGGKAGGYAARRAAARGAEKESRADARDTGDALHHDFDDFAGGEGGGEEGGEEEGEEEEEEGADALRRGLKARMRAIKSHGGLERGRRRLRRLGILRDGGDAAEEEEEEEEEDEDGAEENDEAAAGGEEAAEADEGQEADEGAPREAAAEVEANAAAAAAGAEAGVGGAAAGDLPFVFPAPTGYAQFASWVSGRPPADLSAVVARIRACHAIALVGANRGAMQALFGFVLTHFEALSTAAPAPLCAHANALVPHLLALSREVPLAAGQAVRARLAASMAARKAAGLSPPPPPGRTLALLRLACLLFPTTDFWHPVGTPAALLGGCAAATSVLATPAAAGAAVLLASLLVDMAAPAGRVAPEAVALLSSLVWSACRPAAAATRGLPPHAAHQVAGADLFVPSCAAGGGGACPSWWDLLAAHALHAPPVPAAASPQGAAFRDGVLTRALEALAKACGGAAELPAATHLLRAATEAAARILRARGGGGGGGDDGDSGDDGGGGGAPLPARAAAAAEAVVRCGARAAACVHPPLRLHARPAAPARAFAPRFEEDGFVAGRDYDVDRERAEKRKLRHAVAREAKGAARELRKDNRFLAGERAKDAAASDARRGAKQRAALSFLEQQEADFRSGGQGGKSKRYGR